jgi:hypothetical protein
MPIGGQLKELRIIKPEVNYRKLQALNCSMLKVWDENPTLFFEQFKLGKKKERPPTASTIVGDIAHFFALDCRGSDAEFEQTMHKKFAQFLGEKGSGQVFTLCDILFDVTKEHLDENNVCTLELADRFEIAYSRIKALDKYKNKTIDDVWDDFEKKGGDYFKALIDNIGKTVVTPVQIEKGKFVANTVLQDEYTSDFFVGDIHTSFPIEWWYDNQDCSQTPCKSEIDLFKINPYKKQIHLVDLKFTWDNEGFERSYLKLYYYLQQAFYYLALDYFITHIQPEYSDFEIIPMKYAHKEIWMQD